MRGKHYDEGKRRVFTNGGYVGIIIAIVVLAALVATTLLVVLPATEDIEADTPYIVSINYPYDELGAGSDLNKVYLTVTYSDGTTESVALGSMHYEGLDITNGGQSLQKQNVSLSYGGFEDTIEINVKKVDCTLTYTASEGGKIEGDTTQSIVSGGDANTVIATPETGYTFIGWSDGYPYAERTDKRVNANKDYMALFDKTKFNVVFYYFDGTANKEEEVSYGEKAIDVPDENDPKMRVYGYTFVGWSISESDYACVTRDLSIYPRYEKSATDVTVEVSKDANGNVMGKTDVKELGYYEHSDTERAVIIATPSNSREFNEWLVLNSDGEYVSLGKDSTEETIVYIGDKRTPVAFKVSAASDPGTYSVSFLCNEDMDSVELKAQFAYAKSSVTFVNYQNKNTNNVECTVDDVTNLQSIGDKIAESGAKLPDGKQAVINDDEYSINRGLPIPDSVAGMEFIGWYMQSDPTQTLINSTQTFIEPTNLVAQWEKKVYEVVFEYYNENNVKVTYGDSIYVYYQNTISSGGGVPSGIPYRDRYVFNGWLDACTGTRVDDTTQIMMHDEYGTGTDTDFAKGIIRIIAEWQPVEHTLTVNSDGGGVVELIETDIDSLYATTIEVAGTVSIYENKTYTLNFVASEGYKIDSVIWNSGQNTDVFSSGELTASGYKIAVDERQNNIVMAEFKPIVYTVTVKNGSASASGYVIREQNYYSDSEVKLEYNAKTNVIFGIKASTDAYSIERIYVTGRAGGVSYDNQIFADFNGIQDVTNYELVLNDINSDMTVTVLYKNRVCMVNVTQTALTQDGSDYPIMITTLGGRESDYEVAPTEKEYAYGERVFYSVKAPQGEYISALVFDGIITDLYERSGNVYFYDWEINGVSNGVTMLLIDGIYYYSYGTIAKDGAIYMYVERATDGQNGVFEVKGDTAKEYVAVDISSTSGQQLATALKQELGVEEKSVFNYAVVKDRRVTAVKVMIELTENVGIRVNFASISYQISIQNSDYGTTTLTASKVDVNGKVTISATPITGYQIVGYTVNGVTTDTASLNVGSSIVFDVMDICEDKNVVIVYEPIKYNIVFANNTAINGNVYVQNVSDSESEINLLSATYIYAMEYASGARYKITVQDGKRIKKITIDGEVQNVVTNATSFIYANYHVSKAVRIEIEVADLLENSSDLSGYTIEFAENERILGSIVYGSEKNRIEIVTEKGYKLKIVTITGKKEGTNKVIKVDCTQTVYTFVTVNGERTEIYIDLALDEFEGTATVDYTIEEQQYTLTTNEYSVSGGSIIGGGTIYYGNKATVTVNADDNYYVSSFKVNGEEISFVSANWIDKTASSYDGKYTYGVYEFIVGGDVEVEVKFSIFTYKVTLDEGSLNGGTTGFYIDGADSSDNVDRIAHGSDLGITLKANAGYHISKIFVNGVEVDYVPQTSVLNDNTNHYYTYTNVTCDVKIYVLYEINRYEFKYSLINASTNFKSETETGNRLECPDATMLSANVYGNIAHGDNFSIVVTPGASKGYYVYSIRIKYSGYEGGERIRYAGDGFNEEGGTIWFNRFLWDNSSAGSVGVTANIELIEITFKKKVYPVNITQTGEEYGGSVAFSVVNSLDPTGDVYLFDGTGSDATLYKYDDGKIYRQQQDGIFTLTDVTLTKINDEWKFASQSSGEIFDLYFEYGLRYTVSVIPTVGYERNLFVVNGEDRNDNVYNDRYSFNVYRATVIQVEYRILTFEVSVSAVAYQANMSEVSQRNVSDYVTIRLLQVKEDGDEEIIALADGSASFSVVLNYGTKIKLELTPNFAEYGAYIFNLQSGTSQLSISDDPTGTVVYGKQGINTVENLSYKATVRIMEYQVKVESKYDEKIVGETKNVFSNDATGVIAWKTSWNSSTTAKIVVGKGYYVDRIIIAYQDGNETKQTVINNYYALGNSEGGLDVGYSINKNDVSTMYGTRDILTLYGIKGDYTVTCYFAREKCDIIYVVNELDYIQGVETTLNDRNGTYPDYSYDTKNNGSWVISAHYYDEITAIITPKDGYEITVEELTVECLVYDESVGGYVAKLDDNGKVMTYTAKLSSAGQGEAKVFTFHPTNASSAEYYLTSTVRISITLAIKEYTVNTTVVRTTATGDTSTYGNDTSVKVSVRDKNNDQLILGGNTQTDVVFSKNGDPAGLTAQHHGYMLYTFTTPEGYALSSFTVNGYNLSNLIKGDMIVFSQTRKINNKVVTYEYSIKVLICTDLINGSSEPWIPSSSDITVNMEFTPIAYQVKVIVNGTTMDYESVNGVTGVTDGQQISVFTAPSVTHFGMSTITVEMFEGYQITDGRTNIYIGTADGYTADDGNRAYFTTGVISDYLILRFNGENLYNADVSADKSVIYFVFNTGIISYTQTINTMVYSSDNNVAYGESSLVSGALNSASAGLYGGSVTVTVIPTEGATSSYKLEETGGSYTGTLEYFTTIRIDAEPNQGFALYGIYEIVDGVESKIVSGERNISYSTVGNRHTVLISVKAVSGQSSGDREFRIDFKQQATVTLTIANPYKYIESTRRYASYVSVTAYTSENEFVPKVTPQSSYAISYSNTNDGNAVIETYEYTVYVGNYLKFIITDKYKTGDATVYYFDRDLQTATEQVTNGGSIDSLTKDGKGKQIDKSTIDFYAYVMVNGRVSTTKTTVGAITSTNGGSVQYNSLQASLGTTAVLSSASLEPTNTLTIKITPADNYAFYRLKIRQPNLVASKKQGYIVFETTDSGAWNYITRAEIGQEESHEGFAGSNYLKLIGSSGSDEEGYTFTFWVCGDAEFEVEFYRTYEISYGIYLTDVYTQSGADVGIQKDGISFVEGSVSDLLFGEDAVSAENTSGRVSYNAEFEIVAEKPIGDYQFVGWYVNDYNLFSYLDSLLPGDDYLAQKITVNLSEMQSLISDGSEVEKITVYAVFQPVIEVMVYNEKFYEYEDHFNSWDLATVLASYYPFVRDTNTGLSASEDTVDVRDVYGQSFADAINNVENSTVFKKFGSSDTLWSELLNGQYLSSYTGDLANSKVYSSYQEITTLYQNITNADYYTNSWENTSIRLNLTNLSSTTAFSSWQYYNWNTQEWTDIRYTYEDKSLGMSSSGKYTTVDCYFSSYTLNLSALYTLNTDGTAIMPYAISATSENNVVNNDGDQDGIRPLLLRADIYQTVTVNLSQNLYKNDLYGEDPEQTLMPDSLAIPKILTGGNYIVETTPNAGRSTTTSTGRQGTYEYGTKITVVNNSVNPGGEIISQSTRYRFLGWFMKYDKMLYYMENSEFDASNQTTYQVALTCLTNKPETEFRFIAIYVAQLKQTIYSYNISHAETEDYSSASAATNSINSAPIVTFDAGTDYEITFRTFTQNSTGKVTYEETSTTKYYWINSVSSKSRLSVDGTAYSVQGRDFNYYVDVGLEYTISLPDPESTENTVSLSSVKSSSTMGYCPDTDTPYKFLKNSDTKAPLLDFSSYYNTGYGTYYDAGMKKLITAQDLHDSADGIAGVITNTKEDSKSSNQYDLMYVSTATLVFYNFTYQGGVTVPASLGKIISGGATSGAVTVWDESTLYGDYEEISNGQAISLGANGETVIRVTLKCVIDAGYQGTYKFAMAGMANGQGFSTSKPISGDTGNGLFSKNGENANNFTRWKEIDLSTYVTTFYFGNSSTSASINQSKIGSTSTSNIYTTANCGSAKSGYRVTSVEQIKNIEKFWTANDQSCVGITVPASFVLFEETITGSGIVKGQTAIWEDEKGEIYTDNYLNYYGKTTFILTESSYNITGASNTSVSSNPASGLAEWTPLFSDPEYISDNSRYLWGTNRRVARNGGFDGILQGTYSNGAYTVISGIITDGDAKMADYYGMFANVSGGEITGIVIDNAYVYLETGLDAVGAFIGNAEYSTIKNIKLTKVTEYGKVTSTYKSTAPTARTLVSGIGADYVGGLIGRVYNTIVSGIEFVVASASGYAYEVEGDMIAVGALIGIAEGSETAVSGITVEGNNSWLLVNVSNNSNATYAGGLVGEIADGAVVSEINITNTTNIMVGNVTSTVGAGGVVGKISDSDSVLANVELISNVTGGTADNMVYDDGAGTINGLGIYVLSRASDSGYSSATSETVGKAGGLVGYNEGTVSNHYGADRTYGQDDGKYVNVKGVFKMAGGMIGGIVGVNAGRVTGFSLSTGNSSTNSSSIGTYQGITILAWLQNQRYAYGVGGIVGANICLSGATESPKEINDNDYSLSKTMSGIVDDCSVVGVKAVTSTSTYTNTSWFHGHIYAFIQTDMTDQAYKSFSFSNPGNTTLSYNYRHNLAMGGIVGYSSGSVLNSFVKNTKLTFKVETNVGKGNKSTQSPIASDFGWGVEAGLILGYHDPSKEASVGWDDVVVATGDSLLESNVITTLSQDLLTGRVQSCYSMDSVISVAGRVYLSDTSYWKNPSKGDVSDPTLVSLAGIVGGSSKKAHHALQYTINACYATGNVYINEITPWGSSGSDDWNQYKTESGLLGFNKTFFTHVWRGFYVMEYAVAHIVAGSHHDSTGSDTETKFGNYATNYLASSGTIIKSTDGAYAYSDPPQYWDRSSADSWWGDDDYPSTTSDRWTLYTWEEDAISMLDGDMQYSRMGGQVAPTDSISINNKLVRTDPTTGMLETYAKDGNTTRKGTSTVSSGTTYTFYINGEPWTFYSLMTPSISSASDYIVRGQE